MSHVKTIALVGLIGAALFGVYKIMNGDLKIGGLEELGAKHAQDLEAAAAIALPQGGGPVEQASITIDPLAHLGPLAVSLPSAPGVAAAAGSPKEPRSAPIAPDLVTGRAYRLAGVANLLADAPFSGEKDAAEPSVLCVLKSGTKIIVVEVSGQGATRAYHVSVDGGGDFGWIAGTELGGAPPVAVAPTVSSAPADPTPTEVFVAAPAAPVAEPVVTRPRRSFLVITLGDGRTLRAESVNYVGENAKVRIEGGIVLTYAKSWVTVGDATEIPPAARTE